MTPDPYRWPPRAGVIHPGANIEGDRCAWPTCFLRRKAAWIAAGRPWPDPNHESHTP